MYENDTKVINDKYLLILSLSDTFCGEICTASCAEPAAAPPKPEEKEPLELLKLVLCELVSLMAF